MAQPNIPAIFVASMAILALGLMLFSTGGPVQPAASPASAYAEANLQATATATPPSAIGQAVQAATATAQAAVSAVAGSCGGTSGGCGCGGGAARTATAPTGPAVQAQVEGTGNLQVMAIRALASGVYDKPSYTVKAGIPVRLDFTADANAGCGSQFILDGFNVRLVSRNEKTESATFTPTTPGKYSYHCGMNMWVGTLEVVA